MEEERKELPAPPRFRHKLLKVMTLTLLFLVILFSIGFVGLETTSSSKFCSSCHEMKPEYYTWKSSAHSEVDCVNCHIQPGAENLAKEKANGLMQLYKKQTQTYTAPIRMPKEIPDSACERCHNIFTRDVTPTGDLIIPHDKHKKKGITCAQCHQGVAHGKIADRKMTFQADYSKWDDTIGRAAMKDLKFVKPDMDTCMDCHKVRKAPMECTACHTTGMFPKSHKDKSFKPKTHGKKAKTELKDCNVCHKDMSKEELEGYEEIPTINKFLGQDKNQAPQKTQYNYAKENTFCRDCHMKRPPSHENDFMRSHGGLARQNKEMCAACHEFQQLSDSPLNNVACSSCHPSSHNRRNDSWRQRHPIQVTPNQKLNRSCYLCHNEAKCGTCHKKLD